ncbi:MAG: hypothetical protein ACRC67_28410 [Inquilinus sp.]|uniref:hypothetical protein n=1 Tax=Inquilinus sp. TaxID=1932117 RepID=UPI003F321558
MARHIAAAAAMAVIALAACSYEEAGNQDFVNFEVDPIAVTPSAVQPKADAHCAKYGRQAVLADFFGTKMTFNCVEPAKAAAPTFVP